ncbi:hypothetical protein GCWU000342_01919 [Shuttleworthella satelles DSM 14600]|uniref:Uncharacterized protein n=1 Tax=Shuttleworthella satelles DSM 14600 TaxID=626523 RepID=C4GD74_9FIRM|nr:hypothetical protein GCWU000342_01919 [Shuttleworthia satelles DSM 14600]
MLEEAFDKPEVKQLPKKKELLKGRWDLSGKDSFVPSNRLFQRIREALEILYLRQTKLIS